MSEEFGTEAIRNRITGHEVRGARHQYLKLRPEQLRIVTDGVRRMIFPDQPGPPSGHPPPAGCQSRGTETVP